MNKNSQNHQPSAPSKVVSNQPSAISSSPSPHYQPSAINHQPTPVSPNQPSAISHEPVIYSYSRLQAIADGLQVDVSKVAAEAGIHFPVFVTRAVFDRYVAWPPVNQPSAINHEHPALAGQDEAGRLWDIIWMTRFAIIRMRSPRNGSTLNSAPSTISHEPLAINRLPVALYVRNHPQAAQLVKLIALCGPLDIDDPQPAITIMLPYED